MYLFPALDRAVQDAVCKSSEFSEHRILSTLEQELRICSLFLPLGEFIVIPRTFWYESKATRVVLRNNSEIIDCGLIRLLSNEMDAYEFRESKMDSYQNVKHIEKYFNAYYSGTDHGISKFNFQLHEKSFKPGRLAHDSWEKAILEKAILHNISTHKVIDFIHRISEADSGNSTWESVSSKMTNFTSHEVRKLRMRQLSFVTYNEAHRLNGVYVITGSMIANLLFTGSGKMDFNLAVFSNYLKSENLFFQFSNLSLRELISFRNSAPIKNASKLLMRGEYPSGRVSEEIKSLFRVGRNVIDRVTLFGGQLVLNSVINGNLTQVVNMQGGDENMNDKNSDVNQKINKVRVTGEIKQTSDSESTAQSIEDATGAGLSQTVSSERSKVSIGKYSATGKWGVVALVIIVLLLFIVKALKDT